jgi:anthranilate phosphoribosyltransferase
VRTVFNIIGPLLNPLQPPYQLVGVYDGSLPPVYADILGRLGRKRAWVVHGRTADGRGMDEVSTLGVTEVVAVEGGRLTATTLGGPEHPARVEELVGGDAAHNAALLEGILTGKDRGPRREIVVMNAAAAFQVAGLETTWEGGRARAEEAIDSGRAAGVLAALRAFA